MEKLNYISSKYFFDIVFKEVYEHILIRNLDLKKRTLFSFIFTLILTGLVYLFSIKKYNYDINLENLIKNFHSNLYINLKIVDKK